MGETMLLGLEKSLQGMKRVEATGFSSEKTAADYFMEKEGILDEIGKSLGEVKGAADTEIEALKGTLKEMRQNLKGMAAIV